MRRALALTLACCCLLSGVALAVPATGVTANVARPTMNTTSYLTIAPESLETAGYRQASLDASATLALDARGLDAQFEQLTLDQRFAATESTNARRAQLRETAARIEARIDRLRERQSTAIGAYNNGSISTQAFLRELAHIDARAGRLETAADRVADRASSVSQSTIDGQPAVNWARNRYIELGPLEGPVRDRIAETLRGENTESIGETVLAGLERIGPVRSERLEPLQLYVETSENGVVLATADDNTYYREASLPGERNTTGEGLADITDAFTRVKDRYPWAWNNSVSTDSSGDRRAGIYQFTLFHEHGTLTTYLDRNSGRVFAEQQQKNLRSVPTAESVTDRTGTLVLTVNRTHPTGPLELSLSATEGGSVDGRISIDGEFVGRTGSDGHLWTVTPRGTVTVVAHANERTVRVETSAVLQSNRRATAPGVSRLAEP